MKTPLYSCIRIGSLTWKEAASNVHVFTNVLCFWFVSRYPKYELIFFRLLYLCLSRTENIPEPSQRPAVDCGNKGNEVLKGLECFKPARYQASCAMAALCNFSERRGKNVTCWLSGKWFWRVCNFSQNIWSFPGGASVLGLPGWTDGTRTHH